MSAVQRIVLVGLPGAGKSTVGALVAAQLGWRFVDLDRDIERAAGKAIPEIFGAEGEEAFRKREHQATVAYAGTREVVIAPGAGWLMDPANLKALGPGSLTVFLEVSPDVAAARLASAPGSRPLLDSADSANSLKNLLALRAPTYLQANHTVRVDLMTPVEVASIIVALA